MKLQICDLCKQFDGVAVLDHVSMELESGHIYCLMAPSGKGKTTLFRILMGLESADGGQILTEWEAGDGREFAGRTDGTRLAAGAETVWNRGKAALCGIRIAAVFQEDRLCESFSAVDNVLMTAPASMGRAEAHRELLELLPEEVLNRLDAGTKAEVVRYLQKKSAGKLTLLSTHQEEDIVALNGISMTLP